VSLLCFCGQRNRSSAAGSTHLEQPQGASVFRGNAPTRLICGRSRPLSDQTVVAQERKGPGRQASLLLAGGVRSGPAGP
jgi:hypothetical protein